MMKRILFLLLVCLTACTGRKAVEPHSEAELAGLTVACRNGSHYQTMLEQRDDIRLFLTNNDPDALLAVRQGRADVFVTDEMLLGEMTPDRDRMAQVYRYLRDEQRKVHNLAKLQKMVDYCHTPDCLRAFIIRYFGGTPEKEDCGNCSSCQDDTEKVDVTIEAQKIFSCVYRMHERFGLTLVAQVLKGSTEKRVHQLHFDELSTYGIMRDHTLSDIKLFMQRFIAQDYMALSESEFPVVQLRPAAYAVMRGQLKVWQPVPKKQVKKQAEPALFDHLRDLRKEIAQAQHIPPYLVFSDATLRDMCAVMPRNLDEMLSVKGVGEQKLNRFGQQFLDCIQANK